MFDAGVAVYEYKTIVHAKVIIADDIAIVGTINLDTWALYRNHEIAIMFDDEAVAADARSVLVEDVLSRSAAAEIEDGVWDRTRNWFWDKLEYVL
jgi:phosphatidylserine/phosphatidylglycerophosphate/cardiolipin synthase-like enzyme